MPTVLLDKVSPATAAALQLGDSGDTITVPSGVTLTATDATVSLPATITASTEIKTNKISPGSGTAFTFGDSGDTFNIPSGATITNSGTASGFGSNVPSSADGQALGSVSAEWSDLYLADGGVIYFGNDQDTTVTHVPDGKLEVGGKIAIKAAAGVLETNANFVDQVIFGPAEVFLLH